MARLRRSNLQLLLLVCLASLSVVQAGGKSGYWAPAHCSTCGTTPAKPAVCPASNPVSCSSIGESDYCCPSNNVCTWANHKVACCPEGCTCNSWQPSSSAAAPASSSWAPASSSWAPASSSSWAPTTTWHSSWSASASSTTSWHPDTTGCDECQWNPQTFDGYYCSTIYAHGPNLPTTAHADCGTVLIIQPAEAVRLALGWLRIAGMVVGLQVLGGWLMLRR